MSPFSCFVSVLVVLRHIAHFFVLSFVLAEIIYSDHSEQSAFNDRHELWRTEGRVMCAKNWCSERLAGSQRWCIPRVAVASLHCTAFHHRSLALFCLSGKWLSGKLLHLCFFGLFLLFVWIKCFPSQSSGAFAYRAKTLALATNVQRHLQRYWPFFCMFVLLLCFCCCCCSTEKVRGNWGNIWPLR